MEDPYVLKNGTLKNLLGITDCDKLKEAETDLAYINLISATSEIKVSRYSYSQILKAIHKYIFKNIYSWAGEYRIVPLYKEEIVIPGISLNYARPQDIEKELDKCFKSLEKYNWNGKGIDELASELTQQLVKIWKVHPFRDGNTRTTLTFGTLIAQQHGLELDLGTFLDDLNRKYDKEGNVIRYNLRDKFVLASLDPTDYPEPQYLEAIIKKSLQNGQNKSQYNSPNCSTYEINS